MRPVCTFTDFFVICTGRNARQTASIWDEVHGRLKQEDGLIPRTADGSLEGTWVLGDYLDAQERVNGVRTGEREQSAAALSMNKLFTTAIPFEERPAPFPAIEEQALHAFCQDEYGGDADSMYQAIQAAHEFYGRGPARLSETHVVMFVIR